MSGREPTARTRTEGFSLVVVLVFMMVIMMLGITAMQASGLQERMASHSRDRAIAFQAAETALRAGEQYSRNLAGLGGSSTCADAFCTLNDSPDLYSYGWSDSKSSEISTTLTSPRLAQKPRFFVNVAGVVRRSGNPDGPGYRISAHATGYSSTTSVTLQSVYVP